MRTPSRHNVFAIFWSIGETTFAAAASTRRRSCVSGCGKATAIFTVSSTNFCGGGNFFALTCDVLVTGLAFCWPGAHTETANQTLVTTNIFLRYISLRNNLPYSALHLGAHSWRPAVRTHCQTRSTARN